MIERTAVDVELLNRIVRAANDAGREGRRILSVVVPRLGGAADSDTWIFIEDEGPRTAAESWR